jgi:NAD(P)H dehydrogenase (quinone)
LGSLPRALASGTQYSAAGQGKIPYIGRDDLARADAAALVADDTAKKTYELTGRREYSTEEIAALVSNAVGKPLKVVQVPVDGLIQGMIGGGLPEPVARMVASFDVNAAQGGFEGVTGDYKVLTGREPQSFEDWLKAKAKAFGG